MDAEMRRLKIGPYAAHYVERCAQRPPASDSVPDERYDA
jgi:hypothetical protein